MNIKEFNELADKTRLSIQSRKIGKAVLIDGLSQASQARRFNVSRQRVFHIISRIVKDQIMILIPKAKLNQVKDIINEKTV